MSGQSRGGGGGGGGSIAGAGGGGGGGGGSGGVGVPSWAWLPTSNEVFGVADPVQCRPLGSPPMVDEGLRAPGVTEVLQVMEHDTEAWSVGDGIVKDSTKGERREDTRTHPSPSPPSLSFALEKLF
jgi:hypothetical protein